MIWLWREQAQKKKLHKIDEEVIMAENQVLEVSFWPTGMSIKRISDYR